MWRFAVVLLAAGLLRGQQAPFTAEVMWRLQRISEPQLSPDGRSIAFTVEKPDVTANTRPKQIFVVPATGGNPVPLTTQGSNYRARWMPDSRSLIFVSTRSGSPQIWRMNADGTDARQLTTLANGADGVIVSPDGATLVFTSAVYPDCPDLACTERRAAETKEAEKLGAQPRTYTNLLYRHWNQWQPGTRSHLLAMPLTGGSPIDLTPGNHDVPTFSLGGQDDYAISSDSKEVAYVVNTDRHQATSTNTEIYTVPISGGEASKVTTSIGADRAPIYSPDGRYLAFRSQPRAGYESDRWSLMLLDRKTGISTELNPNQDRNVEEIAWARDSSRVFFTVEDRGRSTLHVKPVSGGSARIVISGESHVGDVQFAPDGNSLIYSEHSGARPVELFRASAGGGRPVPLTNLNNDVLRSHALSRLEEFWVENPADRSRVHSFLIRPPNMTPGRKYPLLLLIHGGPQGAWGHSWSYRWNPQVFASAGYVVVMPNPRGSTGYGQRFTDEINRDWAGRVYEDIMNVVDYSAALPYVDGNRLAAAGGSYGGYMVNWILGHSNRFRALVSHAGVFDLRSMAGETEELWFPAWEFGGMPWNEPDLYAQLSPSHFVSDFKTPTLVTHGELDYRVPVGQGLQLFTALQVKNVPSKLVLFPDEGHWILKPRNSLYWYRSFLDWIGEWTQRNVSVTSERPAQSKPLAVEGTPAAKP
jgi:dipeptidyl aminopeptidase/acylaminoacyl peptidase